MKRIAVDCRSVHRSRGGIGRYAERLGQALPRAGREDQYALLFGGNHPDLAPFERRNVSVHVYGTGMIDPLWEQLQLPTELERLSIDLYHGTCFSLPVAIGARRAVSTIHDTVFHSHPELVAPRLRDYLDRWSTVAAERADHVITVSQFSKQQICETYGLPAERVTTIHNGVDPRFRPALVEQQAALRQRLGLPDRFVLYMGSIEAKKGIAQLLEAAAILGAEGCLGEVCPMVLAGGGGGQPFDLDRVIEASGAAGLVRALGYVDEADVVPLLSAASVFVYPSLYEGFGLPVLEAMACSTPVVTSNSTSLPEVAGDAALLVDPSDPRAIATGLARLLEEDELRSELTERGRRRATEFTWERSAAQHRQVYDQVLAS